VPPKAGTTHEEIIRNVLKPVDGRTEKRSIHGLAATHFSGTARNDQGQTRPVTLTLVTAPGERTFWLQYAAKDAAARQRAEAGLVEAESSFRAMTAADRAAAKPWSVRTVPFPRGGFAELAKSSPLPPARAEAQLRLMNGVYGGDGTPKPGQLVKIVN
jgi:predicted Zn-dependent protease